MFLLRKVVRDLPDRLEQRTPPEWFYDAAAVSREPHAVSLRAGIFWML